MMRYYNRYPSWFELNKSEKKTRCEKEFDEFCRARGYRFSRKTFDLVTLAAGRKSGTPDAHIIHVRTDGEWFDHPVYFRFVPSNHPAAVMSFSYNPRALEIVMARR